MKRLGLVQPMVTAAGILALSGVALAQREGDARSWMGGMSLPCPYNKLTLQSDNKTTSPIIFENAITVARIPITRSVHQQTHVFFCT